MAQPAQPQEPSLVEKLLKPLFDRIGLNGVQPLQAQQKPKLPAARVDRDQLKKQGWSDADIDWWIRTHANVNGQ